MGKEIFYKYVDAFGLTEKTGINLMIANDAVSCVALGTGKALDNLDALDR